jgi:hypothetical protein
VIGAGSLRWLAPLLAAVAPVAAGAVPPPPSPTGTYTGPRPVCLPRFAINLAARERAERYSDDYLVVTGPGLSLGIRVHPAANAADAFRAFRANRLLQPAVVPGVGNGQRHPFTEWPGNRRAGWAYWFPLSDGPSPDYLVLAANQFTGTAADYPTLRRVLTRAARRTICRGTP